MSRRQCSSRSERPTIRERGEYADGNGLRRVVTVASATRSERRTFKDFAAKHGLTIAGDFSGWERSTFDVVGDDDAVLSLLEQTFVLSWEYATNAKVTNVSMGTGKEKRPANKQREVYRELERTGEVDRLSLLLFVYGADYPRLPLLPTEFDAVSPLLSATDRWTLFVQVHRDYVLDRKSDPANMGNLAYWLACERKLEQWAKDKRIAGKGKPQTAARGSNGNIPRGISTEETAVHVESSLNACLDTSFELTTNAGSVRNATEEEMITLLMKLHPSARFTEYKRTPERTMIRRLMAKHPSARSAY